MKPVATPTTARAHRLPPDGGPGPASWRLWERLARAAARVDPLPALGRVVRVVGLTVEAAGVDARVGDICRIDDPGDRAGAGRTCLAEVVGFRDGRSLLLPLGELTGIGPGSRVERLGEPLRVPAGAGLLGRVLDALGRPMDGRGELPAGPSVPLHRPPPHPLKRPRIVQSLSVGVRSIDTLLTCGRGQRVGIFAGSGVGKSTLLSMMARNTEADVNVIALVGERGREVREFLEGVLGEEGLARSVVVVATSDQPALMRLQAAFTATAIAEGFRDRGCDVLLMMDSVTRIALAQREVGLAVGEPPATKGYTPSVFALLPRLLERAGAAEEGTITGFYTVLVEGGDLDDPVADTLRAILDGHVVLSRELAERGLYPAVDIPRSLSRVMAQVLPPERRQAAQRLREWIAAYLRAEELIEIGAYVPGTNPAVDEARARWPEILAFLKQAPGEPAPAEASWQALFRLVGQAPAAGGAGGERA